MPYINVKVSTSLTAEKEQTLTNKLGKAIEILPGKTEAWLMIGFESSCSLYFHGDGNTDMAFVEVKIFGKADAADYDNFTAEITNILHEELAIQKNYVYVKYEECSIWGYNGKNL